MPGRLVNDYLSQRDRVRGGRARFGRRFPLGIRYAKLGPSFDAPFVGTWTENTPGGRPIPRHVGDRLSLEAFAFARAASGAEARIAAASKAARAVRGIRFMPRFRSSGNSTNSAPKDSRTTGTTEGVPRDEPETSTRPRHGQTPQSPPALRTGIGLSAIVGVATALALPQARLTQPPADALPLGSPGHAVSVTGMSTTWISEPSIALTS